MSAEQSSGIQKKSFTFNPPYKISEPKPLDNFTEWIEALSYIRMHRLNRMVEYSKEIEKAWSESYLDDYAYGVYRDLEYTDFIMGTLAMREGMLLHICEDVFKNHIPQSRLEQYQNTRVRTKRWYYYHSLEELSTIGGEKIIFDEEHQKPNRTEKSRTEKLDAARTDRNIIAHNGYSLPPNVDDIVSYCRDLLALVDEELAEVIDKVNTRILESKETSTK